MDSNVSLREVDTLGFYMGVTQTSSVKFMKIPDM